MTAAFGGPLFIVGMPRSGTKLLREMLNRHSRIRIAGIETEFLPWLAHRFARFGDLRRRARFEAFYAEMQRHSYFRYRREQGSLVDAGRWHAACAEFSPAGVFEALLRVDVDAPRGSRRIWGDKSPSYMDDLPLIRQLYPPAKVVHIVRDVRDYCLSMHKAWGKDMLRAAQRWADSVRQARKDGADLGANYLELRYEDLVAHPERQLRRICRFLGVQFEPGMLTLTRPAENLGDARGTSRVLADNRGKFRRAMAAATLARIEELAGPVLAECGYELVLPARPARRLSALEMRIAQAKDGWRLARADRNGWGFWRTALFHLRYFAATRG
ncbi:MAG TPA: sulfotransferase [Burkholderiales bacterium]|nr:sulfotransferase [Burkholderiales bacterium]